MLYTYFGRWLKMLAKRLRELRSEKSLSQSDIAKIVGVSQQAIGN